MIKLIAGFALPIVLAPAAFLALRPLFRFFIDQGVALFLDREISTGEAKVLGHQLALLNVTMFVLTWLLVFGASQINLALSLRASLSIAGVVVALAVTILLVRAAIAGRGWGPTQIGLLSFAGGNLPLFLVTALTLWAF